MKRGRKAGGSSARFAGMLRTMYQTRTGGFPIGFRRAWFDWQKDLGQLIHWAKDSGLQLIDVGGSADDAEAVAASGLKVGSVDLLQARGLITDSTADRDAFLKANEEHIRRCCVAGATNFFTVLIPANQDKSRAENLELLVAGLQPLAAMLEAHGGHLVIEGWPGPGALGCTPESLRAIFARVPSASIGINFDPSHLIRMGIDPVRFLQEFGSRVHHVHGKDTELNPEALYEFGWEQPATLAAAHGFGFHCWRYTIPGQGCAPWPVLLDLLVAQGYQGAVCIELEDERFCTGEAGEKAGFLASAAFLAGC